MAFFTKNIPLNTCWTRVNDHILQINNGNVRLVTKNLQNRLIGDLVENPETVPEFIKINTRNSYFKLDDSGNLFGQMITPPPQTSELSDEFFSTIDNLVYYTTTEPGTLDQILNQRIPSKDKGAAKDELLRLCKERPYCLLNTILLDVFRARLGITLMDIRKFTSNNMHSLSHFDTNGLRYHRNYNVTYSGNLFRKSNLEILGYFLSLNWSKFSIMPPGIERNVAPCEILRYSTKVEQVIPVSTTREGIMGFELELEASNDIKLQEALKYSHTKLKKHCIFKQDGSISRGFEIVSKPALLNEHKEVMRPFFDEVSNHLIARSNCGMHIHLSRKGLSFLQIAKMIEFVNNESNQEIMAKLAGRMSNHYCVTQNTLNISKAGRYFNSGQPNFGERYSAINLQNSKTIEFRIFASTTNFSNFMLCLEFVAALRSYTIPGATNLKPKEIVHHSSFSNWVGKYPKEYPELHKFFKTNSSQEGI